MIQAMNFDGKRMATIENFKRLIKMYTHDSCYSGICQPILKGNYADVANYLGLLIAELNDNP